jgi:hypothetical protein
MIALMLPGRAERDVVVFWALPSVPYGPRLAASFLLIAGGLLVQLVTGSLLPGGLLLVHSTRESSGGIEVLWTSPMGLA